MYILYTCIYVYIYILYIIYIYIIYILLWDHWMGIPNSWSHWNHLHPIARASLTLFLASTLRPQMLPSTFGGAPYIFTGKNSNVLSFKRKLIGGCSKPSEKDEFVSWDDDIPNRWKNKKCSKPPTSYWLITIPHKFIIFPATSHTVFQQIYLWKSMGFTWKWNHRYIWLASGND